MQAFVTRAADFIGFNPYAHLLVMDGCSYSNKGTFLVARPGMAGHPVLSYTEQVKTDGAVMKDSATLSETTVLPGVRKQKDSEKLLISNGKHHPMPSK